MTSSPSRFAVLYVDDEVQSLKYFPRMFGTEFRILTAPGVAEAQAVLAEHGDGIGVVITDQRMPGGSGVDLLRSISQTRPGIVRILTTAYSDLDSAIAAVNQGAIYRYVVKPWETADLRVTLLRAMDLFLLQRSHRQLLEEKLAAIQRLVMIDRVRSYAVLATSLENRLRQTLAGLKAHLDALPAQVRSEPRASWSDLWGAAQRESRDILDVVVRVARSLTPTAFVPGDAAAAVDRGLTPLRSAGTPVDLIVEPGLPVARLDPSLIESLAGMLARRARSGADATGVRLRATLGSATGWAVPALALTISVEGAATLAGQDGVDGEADLLAAHLITAHHGGSLATRRVPPDGPGFTAVLPVNAETAPLTPIDPAWLPGVFTYFDA